MSHVPVGRLMSKAEGPSTVGLLGPTTKFQKLPPNFWAYLSPKLQYPNLSHLPPKNNKLPASCVAARPSTQPLAAWDKHGSGEGPVDWRYANMMFLTLTPSLTHMFPHIVHLATCQNLKCKFLSMEWTFNMSAGLRHAYELCPAIPVDGTVPILGLFGLTS